MAKAIPMKQYVYVNEDFRPDEIQSIEAFTPKVLDEWTKLSNSTSNLRWRLAIQSLEPSRIAELIVVDTGAVLHSEPMYSLETKSIEAFIDEFTDAAIKYHNNEAQTWTAAKCPVERRVRLHYYDTLWRRR